MPEKESNEVEPKLSEAKLEELEQALKKIRRV